MADRGLLRRARLHLRRQAHRQLRRHGDRQLLPRPPHHHGRGRRRLRQVAAGQEAGRVLPRLGSRLLLRDRARQHLPQALRVAARRPARGLRPQVHLQPHRLQPQGHRHAGRPRPVAARQARRLRRAAQGELQAPHQAAQGHARGSSCRKATPNSDPSWFGFPITLDPDLPDQPRGAAALPRLPGSSARA